MAKPKPLDPREIAIAKQLHAEIVASKWKSIANFTRAMNDAGTPTDYTTFYRRVNGKTTLPTDVLLAALDLLDVEYLTFVTAAMARAAR